MQVVETRKDGMYGEELQRRGGIGGHMIAPERIAERYRRSWPGSRVGWGGISDRGSIDVSATTVSVLTRLRILRNKNSRVSNLRVERGRMNGRN